MEIRIPGPNESGLLPTAEVLREYVRPFNIAAEQRYGHVVNGRLLDQDGNELRGGLIVDVAFLRSTRNGTTYSVKVRALSKSPAARQAVSGRNGPWACWHGVYAYLQALYAEFPDAVVRSAFITYRGVEEFEAHAPETFWRRAQSGQPYFGELCHNLGWHDWHDAPERPHY